MKNISKGQFEDFLTTEERTAVRRKHDKQMAESNARIAQWSPGERGSYPPATRDEAVARLRLLLGGPSPLEDQIIDALWDLGSSCDRCGRVIIPR